MDWVNDLALLGELLVSCSSDRMLRVWSAQDEGKQGWPAPLLLWAPPAACSVGGST